MSSSYEDFPEDGDPADLPDIELLPYGERFCDDCHYYLPDCVCGEPPASTSDADTTDG